MRFHNFWCISFVFSEFLKHVQKIPKSWEKVVQLRYFIRVPQNTPTGLKNRQNCLFPSHLFFRHVIMQITFPAEQIKVHLKKSYLSQLSTECIC